METVLITGGTGLVGSALSEKLTKKGYTVTHLSRAIHPKAKFKTYLWDVENGKIDTEAIEKADHIIHLAGANIGEKRWTKKRKKEIIDSRVESCKLLTGAIKIANKKTKTFISASGIGYYGMVTLIMFLKKQTPPQMTF